MKKLFILFAFLFAVSTFAATFTFPGWKCTDVAKIDAAIAAAPNIWVKCTLECLKQFARKSPANFEEVLTITTAQAQADNVPERHRLSIPKQYARCARKDLLKAAFVWAKANPSSYDIHFYLTDAAELGLSDNDIYKGIYSNLMEYKYHVSVVKRAIHKLVDVSVTANVTTGKTDFQKLNRKYSKNLPTDKTTWEPVVAMIRTTIDTF